MHRHTHETHALREARTLYPARRDNTPPQSAASLEELGSSLIVSPDDVPLETEDLAQHFLFEATQSSVPSSAPPAASAELVQGLDAALREAFFDEAADRERLREFERIWKHIISRELASSEL